MKLKFALILICLINIQCSKYGSRHYKYKFVYEGKGVKGTSFIPQVIFTWSFDKDHIEFVQNRRTLIDKAITTDEVTGVASYDDLNIGQNGQVFFKINNEPIKTLDSIRSYPFVYFSRDIDSDTLRITYSIIERKYK